MLFQVNIVAIRGAKEKKDTRDPRGEGAGGAADLLWAEAPLREHGAERAHHTC